MKFNYVYFTGLIFGYRRGGMRHEGYFLHSRKGIKNEQTVAEQRHIQNVKLIKRWVILFCCDVIS